MLSTIIASKAILLLLIFCKGGEGRLRVPSSSSGSYNDRKLQVVDPNPGAPVTLSRGTTVNIKISTTEEVLRLDRLSSSSSNAGGEPAARSYGGRNWESIFPILLSGFDCSSGTYCSVTLPDEGYDYSLQKYVLPSSTSTADEMASKLLTQGTFGPTKETLAETAALFTSAGGDYTTAAANWISSQQSAQPSFHRPHYRKRTNQRLRQDTTNIGTVKLCESGTRWNTYSFTRYDTGSILSTTTTNGGSTTELSINGVTYTEVDTTSLNALQGIAAPYVICEVAEYVGGQMKIGTSDQYDTLTNGPNFDSMACEDMNTVTIVNPKISFSNTPTVPDVYLVDLSPTKLNTKILVSSKTLVNGACPFVNVAGPIFARAWENPDYTGTSDYYRFDKRTIMVDNTPGSSSVRPAGIRKTCPSAQKTFLNEDTCVVKTDSSCSPPTYESTMIQLNADMVRDFYLREGLYTYIVTNLRVGDSGEPSPCTSTIGNDNQIGTWDDQAPHRWVRKDADNDSGGCSGGDTTLDAGINKAALVDAINATLYNEVGNTPDIRVLDVVMDPNVGHVCTDSNNVAIGASITVGNMGCWTHSHPDEWGVFDLSLWVFEHPGNDVEATQNRPNPIAQFAEKVSANTLESITFQFPTWKPMWRWNNEKWRFKPLGKYMSTVDFASLDPILQGENIATDIGAAVNGRNDNVEVCGSPGEEASDPLKGNQYSVYYEGSQGEEWSSDKDQDFWRGNNPTAVWSTVTLNANDQLRQRVAWALSQVFVVSKEDVTLEQMSEPWSNYYDTFVRNAFGSFPKLLKEVAFSPLMGRMLTYINSASLAYNIETTGMMSYPDENFAREIMQLFSIGLWKLNQDGTYMLDANGDPILTYTNGDITTFARAWTGFSQHDPRTNYEADWSLYEWIANFIDPMQIATTDRRDVFPKLGLEDLNQKRAHIGDGIQRCDKMPEKSFLRKGARYRYLGSSSISEMGRSDPSWWGDDNIQLVISPTSQLYDELCNSDVNGICRFQSTVELTENLNCSGSKAPKHWWSTIYHPDFKSPAECSIDEPRVVRIDPSPATGISKPLYYEYVRPPCVSLAFPEPGFTRTVREDNYYDQSANGVMCADTRLATASMACCENPDGSGFVLNHCIFQGERVTYATGEARCQEVGYHVCGLWSQRDWSMCGVGEYMWNGATHEAGGLRFIWTNSTCSYKAQISENGMVAVVNEDSILSKPIKGRLSRDTGTYFRVLWGDDGSGSFPEASSSCSIGSSCVGHGNTCVCDVSVLTTVAFTTVPTIYEIKDELKIGASPVDMFDVGTYHRCTAQACPDAQGGFAIYTRGNAAITNDGDISFDEHTIFEIFDPNDGPSEYLLNIKSIVDVGNGLYFRNPPMLNNPVDQTQRDALYEVDLTLDHYTKHFNVAPFISKKLIQFLTTSNPSPSYINDVAAAFSSGTYSAGGQIFGGGEYLDLGAAVAAILLHEEARSVVLDADPTHGKSREPMTKIFHLIRAMELDSTKERELVLSGLREKIGQEPYFAPSVFGFFLPEFQPAGPVSEKGIVSPEAQLFDAPLLMSYINGIMALTGNGLSTCDWWENFGLPEELFTLEDNPGEGYNSCDSEVPYMFRWRPSSWNNLVYTISNAPSRSPPPPGQLTYLGDDAASFWEGSLGHCEGLCDYNGECEPGLICTSNLPGCEGTPQGNYCYNSSAASTPTPLSYLGNVTEWFVDGTLGKCEGHCSWDGECQPGLKCWGYRGEGYDVPGCDGIAETGANYCYDPASRCGCNECTEEVQQTMTGVAPNGPYACIGRIDWLWNPNGGGMASEDEACAAISSFEGEYPDLCGPGCDPGRCDMSQSHLSNLASDAALLVSELDILLTGGRLNPDNRAIIEQSYVDATARRDLPAEEVALLGLQTVQKLFAVTPEFQITNRLMDTSSTADVRNVTAVPVPETPEAVTGYKAIVYLFLAGAMDSYNAIIPMNCDLHQQYLDIRGDVAITQGLLPITVPAGTQPCDTFGLHPDLTKIQELFIAGDASIVANIGALVEPVPSKAEYELNARRLPPALFAHNTQTTVTQTVLAQDSAANGVLGRIGDEINTGASAEIFDAYSISGNPPILAGSPGVSRPADVLPSGGIQNLAPEASGLEEEIKQLNGRVATSVFGETISDRFTAALNRKDTLNLALQQEANTLTTTFGSSWLEQQFQTVARITKSRNHLEAKRDVFFVQQGGYDTHSDNGPKLSELLFEVNAAISSFEQEMRDQTIWENVTIITASEFARTLTSNGLGTDHAWGGNHFVMGGDIRGGRMYGQFPDDLTEAGPLNIGRGRMIPTTAWENLWDPIARWFGVRSDRIPTILPNLVNFGNEVIPDTDLFESVSQPITPSPTPSPTTVAPSLAQAPTLGPVTSSPTLPPTPAPTSSPTAYPTPSPTRNPTASPTRVPTPAPTTESPTVIPGDPTARPTTVVPTREPTSTPTASPTTATPTTATPTEGPTVSPTTASPTTPLPTLAPTSAPTPFPTPSPTPLPTLAPTSAPTPFPTPAPQTVAPTPFPTPSPTPLPTLAPTSAPTPFPTPAPQTAAPTTFPTTATPTTSCGNGICEINLGETCANCPADCETEGPTSVCGNGVCEAGNSEDCLSCPADCNGITGGKPSDRYCCGGDTPCSDGRCGSCTESPVSGGTFCCGDNICSVSEDFGTCPNDCGAPQPTAAPVPTTPAPVSCPICSVTGQPCCGTCKTTGNASKQGCQV